jgi:hypothetical protein
MIDAGSADDGEDRGLTAAAGNRGGDDLDVPAGVGDACPTTAGPPRRRADRSGKRDLGVAVDL